MKLRSNQPLFFTSDTHFYHRKAAVELRPFGNIEEMNAELIRRWNITVPPDGTVFHLGDFAFCGVKEATAILEQLNGTIHLIIGNHDEKNTARGFASTAHYRRLRITDPGGERQYLVLSHYPFHTWHGSHHGAWHLHGHCHGHMPPVGRRLDVGVDCHAYAPLTYDEIVEIMATRQFEAVDHHVER